MKCLLKSKEGDVIDFYPDVSKFIPDENRPEIVYVYIREKVEEPKAIPILADIDNSPKLALAIPEFKERLLSVIHLAPGQSFRADK